MARALRSPDYGAPQLDKHERWTLGHSVCRRVEVLVFVPCEARHALADSLSLHRL
jgi:hypothetical protein